MNQRLLVFIAVLLLVMGGTGLMLTGGNYIDTSEKRVRLTVFIANQPVAAGELFTEDNVRKENKDFGEEEADAMGVMPNSLEGYLATVALADGESITQEKIAEIPEETVSLRSGHFLYYLVQPEEDIDHLTLLKKGDLVNVYLRYYLSNNSTGEKKLVNKQGVVIENTQVKWVKVLSDRRFFALTQRQDATKEADEVKVDTILALEMHSNDMVDINSVKHLGELVAFPAEVVIEEGWRRSLLPEMVNEFRGQVSR